MQSKVLLVNSYKLVNKCVYYLLRVSETGAHISFEKYMYIFNKFPIEAQTEFLQAVKLIIKTNKPCMENFKL